MNKKGISPLISTIVLIFFAIALGAIVMSWGRSNVQESNKCNDLSISVLEIQNAELCYTGEELIYYIENRGNLAIDGLKMSVITSQDIINMQYDEVINPAEISKITTSNTAADILAVKLTPKIYDLGSLTLCPKQGIEIKNIKPCGE